MKKFYIKTFGCQMNVYDSERVASLLLNKGMKMTENEKEADIIIINTCSVREKPLQKLFSTIGRFEPVLKDEDVKIFVMGCVAKQMQEKLTKLNKHIDGVFPPDKEYMIPEIIEKSYKKSFVAKSLSDIPDKELFPKDSFGPVFSKISSSVTIMHGCNNFCTYCIVPFVRGREVSRDSSKIIEEIKLLEEKGIKEITLLGQNVNSYKDDENTDFPKLLYKIAEKTTLDRIRFVTSHPKDFNENLAKAFSEIPTLMPYLHLPAQSGSNKVLKAMKRGYTIEDYKAKIELAKKYCPEISLSSDFITGFPGETEQDFKETLKLLDEIKYDMIYAFAYSPRPLTKAANFEDNVSLKEKNARLNTMLDKQRQIMRNVRARFQHKIVKVLLENKSPRGNSMMGRSEHNIITHALGATQKEIGTIVKVKVAEVLENTLRGEKI